MAIATPLSERKYTVTFQSLQSCSSKDGVAHGFYSAIYETSFSAILTLCHASLLQFNIFSHMGSVLTILAQSIGAKRLATNHAANAKLAGLCTIQALLFLVLSLSLALSDQLDSLFAVLTIAIGLASVFVGNLASPLWHSVWADTLYQELRITTLTRRANLMVSGSILGIGISTIALTHTPVRIALAACVLCGAIAKLCAAEWLTRSLAFDSRTTYSQHIQDLSLSHTLHALRISKLLIFSPFFIGIGMSTASVIPYLVHTHGFDATTIFAFSSIQLAGQFVCTFSYLRVQPRISRRTLLYTSCSLLATAPIAFTTLTSATALAFVYFMVGASASGLSLSIQFIAHQTRSSKAAVSNQVSLTILSTISTVVGAGIGLLCFKFDALCGLTVTYALVIGFSSVVRILGVALIIIGQESSLMRPQAALS